jgi:hypothetical protein
MQGDGILIVPKSSHYAFELERLLGGEGISCMVIPTPKAISGECGVSLLLKREFLSDLHDVLDKCDGKLIKSIYLMPEMVLLESSLKEGF